MSELEPIKRLLDFFVKPGFLDYIEPGIANAPTLYSFDKDGFIKPSDGRVAGAEEQASINDYNTQRAALGQAERAELDAAIKEILPFYEPANTGDGTSIANTTNDGGLGSSTNGGSTTTTPLPPINPNAETSDMEGLNTSGADTVSSGSLGTGPTTVFNPATALPSYGGDNAVTVQAGDTVSSIAKRYDMSVEEFSSFLKTQYGEGADLNSIVAGSKLPLPPDVYDRTSGGINGLDLPAEPTAPSDATQQITDAFSQADQSAEAIKAQYPNTVQVADASGDTSSADTALTEQSGAMTEAQQAANAASLLSNLASLGHWGELTDAQRIAVMGALYNTVDHMNSGQLPGDLGGAVSALGFVNALQNGNVGSAVVSGVSLANNLGEDIASKQIGAALGMDAANVVPGLNLALALESGDTTSIIAAAASFIPVYGPFISVAISLFGGGLFGDDDIPMREGLAHAQWDESGHTQVVTTQDAEGGGATANAWMAGLVNGLQDNLDQHTDANGQPQYGLVPNLLPSVGFKYDPDGFNLANGASGFMYLEWTDESGQTQTRYYDGAGNRGDGSGETLAGDFMQHALDAIAPAWQVQTALAHYQQSGQIELPAQTQNLPAQLEDGLHQTVQVLTLELGSALPTETSQSSKWIDVDGDGYLEQTQWAQANQAMLAVDLNGDGLIGLGETLNLQDAAQEQQARTSQPTMFRFACVCFGEAANADEMREVA